MTAIPSRLAPRNRRSAVGPLIQPRARPSVRCSRIRMFGVEAKDLMERYIRGAIAAQTVVTE